MNANLKIKKTLFTTLTYTSNGIIFILKQELFI